MDHQDPRETMDLLDCQYVLDFVSYLRFLRHSHRLVYMCYTLMMSMDFTCLRTFYKEVGSTSQSHSRNRGGLANKKITGCHS